MPKIIILDKSKYIKKFMRTLFRPDAMAFENIINESGRSDSGVNFVMYFDLLQITNQY
jgi:hypothetical protein